MAGAREDDVRPLAPVQRRTCLLISGVGASKTDEVVAKIQRQVQHLPVARRRLEGENPENRLVPPRGSVAPERGIASGPASPGQVDEVEGCRLPVRHQEHVPVSPLRKCRLKLVEEVNATQARTRCRMVPDQVLEFNRKLGELRK